MPYLLKCRLGQVLPLNFALANFFFCRLAGTNRKRPPAYQCALGRVLAVSHYHDRTPRVADTVLHYRAHQHANEGSVPGAANCKHLRPLRHLDQCWYGTSLDYDGLQPRAVEVGPDLLTSGHYDNRA